MPNSLKGFFVAIYPGDTKIIRAVISRSPAGFVALRSFVAQTKLGFRFRRKSFANFFKKSGWNFAESSKLRIPKSLSVEFAAFGNCAINRILQYR